jgi:MerR family transcriptional regulator, redox-sensitive transcriptional activator SoxR
VLPRLATTSKPGCYRHRGGPAGGHYDPAILDRLALIRFAQRAGFTIGEIRTLFEGFEEEIPMSFRWQSLARAKLEEVDALMDRAQRMRQLLGRALDCGCLRLDDCAEAIRGCA